MTALSVAYALLVMALLGAAALLAEQTLIRFRRPIRWVWVGAIILGSLLPLLPAEPASKDLPGVLFSRPQSDLASHHSLALSDSASTSIAGSMGLFVFEFSGPKWLAPAMSLFTVAYFGLAWLQLIARRRRWRQETIDGQAVLVSANMGPAVVGFFRPAIVVPKWTVELPQERQRILVAHEKSHIAAQDPLLVLGAGACLALMPWNPLMWWAVMRLREAIEIDCDRRVLIAGHSARAYGECLLNAVSSSSTPVLVGLSSRSYAILRRRLSLMLIPASRPSSLRTLAWSLSAVTLVGLACATQPPADPSPSSAPGPGTATASINETVHRAVVAIYGQHAPANAGTPAQFWVVLSADGSVLRHDVGRADLVELSKDDPMYEKMKDLPRPLYSVNASLKKKYPDLGLDNSKKVEFAGGGPIALGTDSAMVFWAKLAK